MSFSNLQKSAAQDKILVYENMAAESFDFKLKGVETMLHPDKPEILYLKISSMGIESGRPFDDIDYYCIDPGGEVSDCNLNFTTREEKYSFYEGFEKIELTNG